MRITPVPLSRLAARAFTLVELLVATALGCVIAGTVLLLLCQSSTEQRNGFADMTVEEKAYILQANLSSCLRSMSANQGMTLDGSSAVLDNNGNTLGYQRAFVFFPTNGGYIMASIAYNSTLGEVIYTPNVTNSTQVVWMSNSPTATLTEFCFNNSVNLDTSQNNSLVNILFQMNDNGFSRQSPVNNPTSLFRNFSIQMRNDN